MRFKTLSTILFFILLVGCYHAGGNDAATDAGSDAGTAEPEPGDLEWAVSLGEYVVSYPHILDVDENGNILVLAGLTLYHPDGDDPYESLGTYILTFDADGNFVEKTLVPDIDFGVRKVVRTEDSFFVCGWAKQSSSTSYEARLARLDNEGSLLWTRVSGGNSSAVPSNIALDENGNIWTVGTFSDYQASEDDSVSFTFGDSSQSLYLPDGTSNSAFFAVHDSEGNLLHLQRLVSGVNNSGGSIAVSSDGSVYVSGAFFAEDVDGGETAVFGEGENAVSYSFSGEGDGYIAKLTGEGDLEWVLLVISSSSGLSASLAAAPDGNVRIAGVARPARAVTFEHPDFQPVGFDAAELFLADVSPDGEVTLFDSPHGNYTSTLSALTVTRDGSAAIAGSCYDSLPIFDPSLDSWADNPASGGGLDVGYAHNTFTAVYDPSGAFEWAAFGMVEFFFTTTYSIAEDEDGFIYTAGIWSGNCFECCCDTSLEITFGLGQANETTLCHEGLLSTGFLTKSYR